MTTEERELVTQAQRGNRVAFEVIVRAHETTVYHLALRQLGNREDAEDASQEVFLRAYAKLTSFRGDCKLSVWLYRITINVCKDIIRYRHENLSLSQVNDDGEPVDIELPDERFDPAVLAERRDLRERVRAALQALPPLSREALILREYCGQSYEEIATTLNIDMGTVKSRIFRARKKLCAIIKSERENLGFQSGDESEHFILPS